MSAWSSIDEIIAETQLRGVLFMPPRYIRQGNRYVICILPLAMLWLCMLLLSAVAFPQAAFAAGSPITVTSQTDTIHFPGYIVFEISAKDASNSITRATISITFNVPGYKGQQLDNTVPIDHPAQIVTLRWRQDTSGNNFYPPGTLVSYDWQLQDSGGYVYNDTVQNLTTIDSRFAWQSLSRGMLHVNWYNRPQAFGQTVLESASASIAHISSVLGSGLLHPINLWIYENDEDFHSSLAPNSYEWTGGEAIPSLKEAFIVVTDTSDDTLRRDMPHELTHLVFHQLIEQGIQVRTWFDEGLAVYNQFYHEPGMTARLQAALDTHMLLRLDAIAQGFPADGGQALLAYAESWNLVAYMYSTFGSSKMNSFIKGLNNPQVDFGQDLQTYLGEDQAHLENQWRIHLHQPPILSPDQLTPTPIGQVINQRHQTPTQTNTDYSSLVLIAVGILLFLGSAASLTLIVVNVNRRQRQALELQSGQQPIPANATRWQQSNQVPPDMRSSMYVQMAEDSRTGPHVQSQEYLSQQPRRQASQE